MKVLIIDSSVTFRKTIGNLFEKLGYELIVAGNLKQAEDAIRKSSFDTILIANELNDGLGMDFAHNCLTQKLIPSETPIFLTVTSALTSEYINKALSLGITDILSKNNIKLIYDQLENYATRKLIHSTSVGCRIVYIEDELDVAEQAIEVIEQTGAKINHFTGTDGVYDFLMHNPIDLLISDVLVDGQESVLSLVYRIRSSFTIKAIIPILIITGADNLSRRIEFFHVGIDDYLIKPFLDIELLARIKNLIIKRQFMKQQAEKSQISMAK